MKTTLKLLIPLLLLSVFFISCKKEDPKSALVDFEVKVNLPKDFSASAKFGGEVIIINKATAKTYAVTAISGVALFKDIYQGIYDIDITQTLNQQEFSQFAPELGNSSSSYTLKGSKSDVQVSKEAAADVEIELNWFGETALLISKIYCNGTKKNEGAINNMPKYWELYNNSDEVIYLDGLCLAQAHGNSTGSDGSCDLYVKYQNEATYAARIAIFPGTHGTTRNIPLQPGKSVVIAWNASNFIITGQPNNKDNCTMNCDLTDADFEIEQSTAAAWRTYGDNQDVPNLTPIHECIPTAGFLQLNQAVFIFYATQQEVESWPTGTDPSSYYVESQKNWIAKRVPNDRILDAVETFKTDTPQNKRIPDILDSKGVESPNNQGIIFDRKIRLILPDGRRILQDTNNSSNDFAVIWPRTPDSYSGDHLVPRNYDKPEIQPGYNLLLGAF